MPRSPRKVTKKAKAILRSSGAKTVRSVADEVIGAAMTAGAAVVVSKLADALKPLMDESSTPEPAQQAAASKKTAPGTGRASAGKTAKKNSRKTSKKSSKKSATKAPSVKRTKASTGGRAAKKK